MRVNSKLPTKGKRFCQTFDHSRDEEIPRQLDHVGGVSFLGGDESLLSNRVEKWPAPLDLFGWPSGNNEQLSVGCGHCAARHLTGHVGLLLFLIHFIPAPL